MGVRFACHACGRRLNVKQELAGRRGKCPGCGIRFGIPAADAETSIPLAVTEDSAESSGGPVARAEPLDPLRWIDADRDAQWYVRPPSGGQYGPAGGPLLRQWIQQGRVTAGSLLWRDGWPQWRDARELLPPESLTPTAAAIAPPMETVPPPAAESTAQPQRQIEPRQTVPPGAIRRKRTSRRATLIGLLLAASLLLLAALVILLLAQRS